MLAPAAETTITFAVPATDILTLPLAAGILILLFPLACTPIKLPAVILPVTPNDISVPTEVIFGCAAVVNVPCT